MNNVVPLDDLFRKRLFRVSDYQSDLAPRRTWAR